MKRLIIPILVGLIIAIYFSINFSAENTTEYVDATSIDLSDSALFELPLSLFYATKLEKLNLRRTHLDELPDEFEIFQELRYLDLSNNRIETLPKSIEALQKLTYLDISDNSMIELPEVICSLKNLKVLKATQYRLKTLPDCICEMKLDSFLIGWEYLDSLPKNIANFDFPRYFKLRSFNINKNTLPIFNQIGKFHPKLQQLSLRYSDLDSFPTQIGALKQLRYLSLDRIFKDNNSKKRALPDIFGQLSNLEIFISQNNYFSSYPSSFQQLTNLRHLSIYEYDKLDSTLFTAINNFKKLEYLKLNASYYKKETSPFPFDLGSLQELKILDLNLRLNNLLKGSFASLKKLEHLRLDMPIEHFEEDLSNLKMLKFLDLRLYADKNIEIKGLSTLENLETLILNTKTKQLPDDFGKLQNLRFLKLDAPLKQLPNSFADLDALDTFKCLTSFTSGIPDVIHQLKNLKVLHLDPFGNIYENQDYNTSLDTNFVNLQSLEELYISNLNNLDFAFSVFSKLENLQELTISNSNLAQTWQHPLQENKSITRLDIRNCQLGNLPKDLGKLKNLEKLNLYRCTFTVFPVDVLNTNVKNLDLSYNQLQEFPEELTNSSYVLEELDLSHNNMTKIPTAILEIPTLKDLDLDGNNFESFDPSLFKGKLPLLETLVLDKKWESAAVKEELKQYFPDCNIYFW